MKEAGDLRSSLWRLLKQVCFSKAKPVTQARDVASQKSLLATPISGNLTFQSNAFMLYEYNHQKTQLILPA
jgi:hypothetical protein